MWHDVDKKKILSCLRSTLKKQLESSWIICTMILTKTTCTRTWCIQIMMMFKSTAGSLSAIFCITVLYQLCRRLHRPSFHSVSCALYSRRLSFWEVQVRKKWMLRLFYNFYSERKLTDYGLGFLVFNATFNNISVILRR